MRNELSMRSRAEITKKHTVAYAKADKKTKGLIPDQACAATGWSRANARRRLTVAGA
ncbi:MAG: hypothetical protein LBI84_01725 [Propionibacteriaceae bacterium]|jgi:hypothetical protein|nr:hypothetical protein [Propionibacteriaceae bacterium]